MKNLFKNLIVIAFLLLSVANYAQVTNSSNLSTIFNEFVGWNKSGYSKPLNINNSFNQPINLWTDSIPRMTITSAGKVGIGTNFTSPKNLLHLHGNTSLFM